jgi:predicted nuclease of predicted toxin-antitoxin system
VTDIRLLADMNISPQTVTALQTEGWDIIRVSDVLPATTPDLQILEFARQEDRVVITQDLDFSMLLALGGYNQPSLVTLRLSLTDPDIITKKLINTIPQVEQILREGGAVTIEDATVRTRRLPMR